MAINITDRKAKPKRAKDDEGKFQADDKSTPDINEAWESGESPKKKSRKKSSKR